MGLQRRIPVSQQPGRSLPAWLTALAGLPLENLADLSQCTSSYISFFLFDLGGPASNLRRKSQY
jgi:hypothetical protein